jgi:ATP-dependent Clp protease ATP-binding subunit ClpC
MFLRFDERARIVVIVARREACEHGSLLIKTEHLLLGLMQTDKPLIDRVLPNLAPLDSIRMQVAGETKVGDKLPESSRIELSDEAKRVFSFAAEEADSLSHYQIGTKHLLLGLLREATSIGARIIASHGLEISAFRDELRRETATWRAKRGHTAVLRGGRKFMWF